MSAPVRSESQPRVSKRMTCAVSVGEQRYSGVVLNVSQGGMFVQTTASPQAGTSVGIELNPPGERPVIPVEAQVVWRRVVPRQLRASAHGGVGIRIVQADENYYQALAEWLPAAASSAVGPEAAPAEPGIAYRVRVRAPNGPRTRWVEVEAASAVAARELALEETGDDWAVLDVELV